VVRDDQEQDLKVPFIARTQQRELPNTVQPDLPSDLKKSRIAPSAL
jgi:hypothetical protein